MNDVPIYLIYPEQHSWHQIDHKWWHNIRTAVGFGIVLPIIFGLWLFITINDALTSEEEWKRKRLRKEE